MIYESGALDTKPDRPPLSFGDDELSRKALCVVSVPEMFQYWLQGGKIEVGFLLVLLAGTCQVFAEPVRIESGLISGSAVGDDRQALVFKGIPYAAPPVGDLRWKPPRAPQSWEGVRACDQFSSASIQRGNFINKGPFSEDCLYLNVWAPAGKPKEKLPVMVWIHGGGFTSGASHLKGYRGGQLARRGVVLVSINYRLGALGFFAHPRLSAESPHGVSGNYGLLDQIAALQWLQKNIGAFGGDRNRVTIFGESAGGTSVYLLVATPLAKGLFQRAILQSPWLDTNVVAHLKEETHAGSSVESRGVKAAQALVGADAPDVIAALRKLSADEILQGLPERLPVAVDGRLLPDFPFRIFANGTQNIVPTIAGTNRDEGTMFTARQPFDSVKAYEESLSKKYGEHAPRLLALYPASAPGKIRRAVVQGITDGWFVRPTREYLRAMERRGAPAWMYHFNRVSQSWPLLGAAHAAEISYVFSTLDEAKMKEPDRKIADAMIRYWIQFATAADPNVDGLPAWPSYTRAKDRHLTIGEKFSVDSGLRNEACDLLDEVVASQRKRTE